ncbi:beta-1,4-mannosyltransferase egh-like [Mercenaria mercenaria]|uniref:beta-1,4-mannosyltransferase egh-like n=1 Tax=Mercenaria mercenaria TaxID=6596 RepID=UPI00234F3082|nr:beta-1,4-mannosyltransferase egh-like [Mercenaria mercenaria]
MTFSKFNHSEYEEEINVLLYLSLSEHKRDRIESIVKHLCAVLTLAAFIVAVTFMNVNRWTPEVSDYGPKTELAFFIIGLVPYLSIPVAILNCFGILFYNPFYKTNRILPKLSSVPFLCLRIVTRGDMPDFVIRNAKYNRDLCLNLGLQHFMVEIVTDKPVNCQEKDRIREIVVPKGYSTKNGSLYKARALNYCLESHVNLLAGNDWIVHLDEETLLTEASVSGILHFVTDGSGDIGQGPISYANGKIINNWITTLADSVRLAMDYSLFRFQFAFLNRPVFGFKGSYVVVRNNVEMEVGLDNGPDGSIAEDCFFALKAWSKGYKFEFITGEMLEKSPFTLKDFIRQRRRWFVGQFYTVLSKEIPLVYKLGICSSIICCILMPISLSNVYIDSFYPMHRPLICSLLNGLVGGTFGFLYCFGAFVSCSGRNWSLIRRIFISLSCCVLIVPIAAAMESIAAYWGLMTLNSNEFFIVQKEVPKRVQPTGHSKIM